MTDWLEYAAQLGTAPISIHAVPQLWQDLLFDLQELERHPSPGTFALIEEITDALVDHGTAALDD